MVFLTASLLTLSVKSSSSRARFTNLFNAGVHFVRISSIPFSFCPDLISFKIDEHIVSQSDKAVAYSSYFFFETMPELFIIFSCESISSSEFAMVCS